MDDLKHPENLTDENLKIQSGIKVIYNYLQSKYDQTDLYLRFSELQSTLDKEEEILKNELID